MRVKIIGENDCARATRRLLRQAGFAVTDFLPSDAVTRVPQSGYAITIELGSSRDIELGSGRDIELGSSPAIELGGRATELTPATQTHNPAHEPEYHTHDHPTPRNGEAESFAKMGRRFLAFLLPDFFRHRKTCREQDTTRRDSF